MLIKHIIGEQEMTISIKKFKKAETEKKVQAMRMIGININDFIEWAILNFDIDIYLKVMKCKQL